MSHFQVKKVGPREYKNPTPRSQSWLGESRDLNLVVEPFMVLSTPLCYLLSKHRLILLRVPSFLEL